MLFLYRQYLIDESEHPMITTSERTLRSTRKRKNVQFEDTNREPTLNGTQVNSESNRERKVARTTATTDVASDCSDSSIQSGDVDSRNIRKTYGNPVIMQPIQSDKNIPVRTLESLMWLRNTYHRDMVDQLMYKTTRVYIKRY